MTPNGKNLTVEFPLVTITVLPPALQPVITDLNIEPGGVNITFSEVIGAEQYEIYGGPTQTSLDLILGNALGIVLAPQTFWIDPLSLGTYDQFYYVVRAVDTGTVPWTRSTTSNTGGYYRVQFDAGENTLSLPLEPFGTLPLDSLMTDMGASSISILDANDDWQTYSSNPPGNARTGEGYVVEMPLAGSYEFTGEPAAMVKYEEGFGFDDVTRDSLGASVDGSGNVNLAWTAVLGADYYILRSNVRNGFFTSSYVVLNGGLPVVGPSYTDLGAASAVGENYYLIVPRDINSGINGSSTYGIGVITNEFNGNEMFGLPVKPIWGAMYADWYVDQIPFALGIVFMENGMWKAHFKEFPEGVYDTIIRQGSGYEVSVYTTSLYSFIGM
jgi:hypothetical protein